MERRVWPRWQVELYFDRSLIQSYRGEECLKRRRNWTWNSCDENWRKFEITWIIPVTRTCSRCHTVLISCKIVWNEENWFPAIFNVLPVTPQVASFFENVVVGLKKGGFKMNRFENCKEIVWTLSATSQKNNYCMGLSRKSVTYFKRLMNKANFDLKWKIIKRYFWKFI